MSGDTPGRETDGERAGPTEIRSRRWNISVVWIVPIVAAILGLSLVARYWMESGPTITIDFKTGEGLVPDKTQVKYRDVVIGDVKAVELSADRSHVTATVKLQKSAESFTRKDTKYWVVRPRIGAGGVSGVDTLVSGDFIGADAGSAKTRVHAFTGLEAPPAITYGEPGKRFILRSADLGSLDIGSPVYYRKIPVGQVVSYRLDPSGKSVDIEIFIHAPHDVFVTDNTRFWNASGISLKVGANGVALNTEALSSILIGGIAFRAPDYDPGDKPAGEGKSFGLFGDQQAALAPPSGPGLYLRMRFEEALKGLGVGAPVEFQGLNIGEVVSVDLDFDEDKQSFPLIVGALIYPQRMGKAHEKMLKVMSATGNEADARVKLMAGLVEKGLRAQARTGNLLTGQLLIALDFYPDAPKAAFDARRQPLMLPTVPASLEKLQDQVQQIVDKIDKMPLDSIARHLDGNLAELRKTIAQVNGEVLPGVSGTLQDMRKTLDSTNGILAEDSPQRGQLQQTLTELERTARALRELSDHLSRHPEALIRGRPDAAPPEPQER